jgi:hypothetical protein
VKDGDPKRCSICGTTLKEDHHNLDLTPWHNCGGDCLLCMAQAGDPDCIAAMREWLDRMER